MKKMAGLVAVIATLATMALTVSPAAQGQPQAGLPIDVTCVNETTGADVDCALTLIGFQNVSGTLNAVFLFTNEVTGQVTRIRLPIGEQQAGAECTILHLVIPGPITLELLGLELTIQTIDIKLTAQRGTLLGDLLCGLFFGPAPLSATLLNDALRTGQITIA